jgi:hypothetical protein
MPSPKELRFNMAMDPTERDMLAWLAERNGVSESAVIRLLVRDAYRQRAGEKTPAPRAARVAR